MASASYNPLMLRLRAVEDLLVSDVAAVRVPPETDDPSDPGSGAPDPAERDRERRRRARQELERTRRKALTMAGVCLVCVVALVATHTNPARSLAVSGVDLLYTVGILLVTAYGGFRIGQWEKLRAVERVLDDLAERVEP